MSLAAETRAAVRARPWLRRALRSGVVNYAAAADALDIEGDRDAVATALRRFEADLPDARTDARDVTVRMRSGVGVADAEAGDGADGAGSNDADDDPLLTVGGKRVVPGAGRLTAVIADGDVDAAALSAVVDRFAAESVVVNAAGVAGDRLVVVVPGTDGANALRVAEAALAAVPTV